MAKKVSTGTLLVAAATAIVLWLVAERVAERPASPVLLAAAERMRAASGAIREARREQGLMQPPEVDRNRTGLIGPEWSEITTTIGLVDAKRTLTNPDLAALVARLAATAGVAEGERVAVVLSGSFVGANVAVLAAIETIGAQPVIVASLAASMFGATDPAFTWLDMESAARARGAWRIRSTHAVLGGESGRARDLPGASRAMLADAAARHEVPLVDAPDFAQMVDALTARLGLEGADRPKLFINAGGAQIALGTCVQAETIPEGLVRDRIECANGTRGLIQRALDRGIPVLNLFKVKAFARRYGLPYDPVPLPEPGANRAIYSRGAGRRKAPRPFARRLS